MYRSIALSAALVVVLGAGELTQAKSKIDPAPDAHASACHHYQNRARFKSRQAPYEFVTLLAEACSAAQQSMTAASANERATAKQFLDRLLILRDTVVAMNMDRVYGPDPAPAAKPRRTYGRVGSIPKVSSTGEYLIARSLGVMVAYDAWLDSGAEFSLASK